MDVQRRLAASCLHALYWSMSWGVLWFVIAGILVMLDPSSDPPASLFDPMVPFLAGFCGAFSGFLTGLAFSVLVQLHGRRPDAGPIHLGWAAFGGAFAALTATVTVFGGLADSFSASMLLLFPAGMGAISATAMVAIARRGKPASQIDDSWLRSLPEFED